MTNQLSTRKASLMDAPTVDSLLSEWFDWKPESGRAESIARAIRNGELLVAELDAIVIGFIHSVMHEDIIDGGPNSFITAFYITPSHRRQGAGSLLLDAAIKNSLERGAVGIETSTIHALAKRLYERHHFRQSLGDIGEIFLELDIPEYLAAKKATQSAIQ